MKNIQYLFLLSAFILSSVDYSTEIQPIFNGNCGNCHLENSSGNVNLSSYENTINSDVITPGNHEQSALWNEINTGDMPAGNNPELSDEEINLIAQWIDEGALEFSENGCDEEYTYIEDIPQTTCVVLDGSNCFYTQDIQSLEDIAELNEISNLDPLYLGFQNWSNGRITRLLIGDNSNGGFITLNELPESIGDLENLVQLYIDDNNLTTLPEQIGNLSNLIYLIANFNNLVSLPESIGNLSNLVFLDLGYNQIEYIPESIGDLTNLEYLWLFDNQLTSVPESICNLNLDWDGYTSGVSVVPYFGIGGNLLCDSENIPDCVANSENFEISLDQFYYSFAVIHPQDCVMLGDVNFDGALNVLDIVTLVNYITGGSNLSEDALEAGDINQDNTINVLDIVGIINEIIEN